MFTRVRQNWLEGFDRSLSQNLTGNIAVNAVLCYCVAYVCPGLIVVGCTWVL